MPKCLAPIGNRSLIHAAGSPEDGNNSLCPLFDPVLWFLMVGVEHSHSNSSHVMLHILPTIFLVRRLEHPVR